MSQVKDYPSRDLFKLLMADEEGHIDFLETQLDLIGRIGLEALYAIPRHWVSATAARPGCAKKSERGRERGAKIPDPLAPPRQMNL